MSAGRRRRRPGAHAISAGAITAGVTVFVVASLIAPLAGADTTSSRVVHPPFEPASRSELRAVLQPVAPTSRPPVATVPASSTSVLTKNSKPAGTTVAAPVDTTVISGLAANGIPSVALNAYRVAVARVDNADPSCGIHWSLLAGIGREESDHGQFAGAVLHSDGISTPAIIGPALNGRGNQFIPAPPNGLALDGDATYAHALGPMQFIPTTWAIYGTDADGDGLADIFDINDASLATARYLCAAGGDLTTHAGRVRAVFAYNHTEVYVAQVLALAHAYQTGTSVTGLPSGNTTGSLPGLGHAGAVPPANPGSPTANRPGTGHGRTEPAHHRHPVTLGGGSSGPTSSTPSAPSTSPGSSRTHPPKPSTSPSSSPHPSASTSPSPRPTRSTPPPSTTPSPSPSATGSSSSSCPLVCLPG